MWDINGEMVQLEIGSRVVLAYSSNRKRSIDILRAQIKELCAQLKKRMWYYRLCILLIPRISNRRSLCSI